MLNAELLMRYFSPIPLEIILKNEAKTEVMVTVAILTHSSQYVLNSVQSTEKTLCTGCGEAQNTPILFGDEQMTAARAIAAISTKINGDTRAQRLDGIIPVFEAR